MNNEIAKLALIESALQEAIQFHQRNKAILAQALPVASPDGGDIGRSQLKALRRDIKRWKQRQIQPEAAILSIALPLQLIREELIRKGLLKA